MAYRLYMWVKYLARMVDINLPMSKSDGIDFQGPGSISTANFLCVMGCIEFRQNLDVKEEMNVPVWSIHCTSTLYH